MPLSFSRSRERKQMRLKNFDYTHEGAYFVTICVQDRIPYFGKIETGKMRLNAYGKIARQTWLDLPKHYSNCSLGQWVIMPDHVHGIVFLQNFEKTNLKEGRVSNPPLAKPFSPTPVFKSEKSSPSKSNKQYSLSEIIRGFKTFSSKTINQTNPLSSFRWQRSFYDHIIRNEKELEKITEYIELNPQNWKNEAPFFTVSS